MSDATDTGAPDAPHDDKQKLREELVKHLSSEIASETAYISSLRTRVAFIVMTGPFIVIGSVLVALKGPIVFTKADGAGIKYALLGGLLSYLGMGIYGAMLDNHHTGLCNKWRSGIALVVEGKALDEKNLIVKNYALAAYLCGVLLLAVSFVCWTYLVLQLIPLPRS
jgi:hypothetical protein